MPTDVEPSRRTFRTLMAANPNHFGTLATKEFAQYLPVIEPKQSDTGYEEICCVS